MKKMLVKFTNWFIPTADKNCSTKRKIHYKFYIQFKDEKELFQNDIITIITKWQIITFSFAVKMQNCRFISFSFLAKN